MKPPTPCTAPGCPNRSLGRGRCAVHQQQQARLRAQTPEQRFYRTARWRKERIAFLAEHPFCACGCGGLATVVDHIKPLSEGGLDDWSNYEGMTKDCHNAKTAREMHRRRSVIRGR